MRRVIYICDNCLEEYESSEIEGILTVSVSRADAPVSYTHLDKHRGKRVA